MRAFLRAVLLCAALPGCVPMHHSEDRAILSASQGTRRLGALGRGGTTAVAAIEGGQLVLSVASQAGRCLFASTARELVQLQPRYHPTSPRWRVGGGAWITLGALGVSGVALGVGLLASGFRADREDLAGAQWLSGALLLLGGAAATTQAALVLARWRRPAPSPFVEERDISTFERGCDGVPLRRTALLLSRGERSIAVATDGAGQVRVPLHHLDHLQLGPGAWVLTRYHSGSAVSVVHLPPLVTNAPRCPRPGRRLLMSPELLHISPTAHLPALRQAALALQTLGAGCYALAEPGAPPEEGTVVLAGEVQEVGGVSALQLRLLAYPQFTALPDASASAVAVSDVAPLGDTLAREVDLLLRAERQGGGAQVGAGSAGR